jgi:hypothetical protein
MLVKLQIQGKALTMDIDGFTFEDFIVLMETEKIKMRSPQEGFEVFKASKTLLQQGFKLEYKKNGIEFSAEAVQR